MRQLTTKEVIKALPIEKETKSKLIDQFDSMEEGKKGDVTFICWKAFHQMRKILNDAKYDEFMLQVGEGNRTLTPTFMQEVEDAAWQEIEDMISGKKEENDKLAHIRKQLQTFNVD